MNSKIWNRGKRLAAMFLTFVMIFSVTGETKAVYAAESAALALNKTEVTVAPATTTTLKLGSVAGSDVTWSSSDEKVATVNEKGKVTARSKGETVITAKYKGVSYKCNMKVAYAVHVTDDGIKYKDAGGNFGRSGRWFKKDIDGGKYYFTNAGGSAIYFKVVGSKYVNVDFVKQITVATPYFAYSVDGGKMKRQSVNKGRISVGNTKTHYVRLVIDAISESEDRWGEAGVGIKSVKPEKSGGVVTAIKPKTATIAFYGDSITEGVRALNMALSPTGTSATHSYAWYCAEQLDLIPYYAGWGGSGISQPGSFNTCYNAITSFSSTRKADKYDADVIVVEHGTNDVYTSEEVFRSEYRKVLKKLHKEHPDAYIMAMIPLKQRHAGAIRSAASGLKYCTVVETASWKISYTDGLHPNSGGAKVMGRNLAKKVAAKRKAVLY